MWLSIALELSKVYKSNWLASTHFWSKFEDIFCAAVNILQEIFFRKYDKTISFFKINMKGWNIKPEIFHEDKTDEFDIPPLHGENAIRKLTYIFCYFFYKFY